MPRSSTSRAWASHATVWHKLSPKTRRSLDLGSSDRDMATVLSCRRVGIRSPVVVAPAIPPGDAGASGSWNVSLALTSTNNIDATVTGAEVIVRADSGRASAAVLSQLEIAPDADGGLVASWRRCRLR